MSYFLCVCLPDLSVRVDFRAVYCLSSSLSYQAGLLMITRVKNRLDYEILHRTGRKVVIAGGRNLETSMDVLEVNELKICGDVKHAFDTYVLDELLSEDEINESVWAMADLSQQFRHIHIELRSKFGEEYDAKYPGYDAFLARVTNFIKSLKSKVRVLKQEEKVTVLETEINALKIEGGFLDLKVKQLLDTRDSAQNLSDVEDFILKMEGFINDYFELSKRAKCSLGKEYDEVFDDKFMSAISGMREEIKVAKVLRQQLCEAIEKGKAQAAHDYERSSQIVKAENLISEIEFRCGSLQRKYEQKFEDLTDYQILDISQKKILISSSMKF